MSKLITTRYESVCYDDAQGVLAPQQGQPPTYPPVLDQYSSNSQVSAAGTYGTTNASGPGTQTVNTTVGATALLLAPSSNATLVLVTGAATPLTPNGSPASAQFIVGPGQTVTFPGVLNPGSMTAVACDTSYSPLATSAFDLQILWSY